MKHKMITALILIIVVGMAFTFVNQPKNLAEVDQIQGLYIYAKSKPVNEYEFLGTIKPGAIGSHEFDNLVEMSIKKAKKEFPEAEGLIFDGSIRQTHNTKVSVIKFK